MIRAQVVDPSAYTPPYDHSLCAALSRAGAEVELITSDFAYGSAPPAQGYSVAHLFYRQARGSAGSAARRGLKLLQHGPDMLRLRRRAMRADVVHFQWLPVQWLDRHLLPRRPVVLTAHDLLPREPRPFQAGAQRRLYDAVSAVVVHSAYGREQLVHRLGLPEAKVRVIHHGAFDYLTKLPQGPLPSELPEPPGPVAMFFGLLRPYKGLEVLLRAWRELDQPEAELWIVGRPRIPTEPLRELGSGNVRFVTRFVSEAEAAACFRRAEVVVLPYSRTERLDFSGVLATALAFGKPAVISDVGGFSEVASTGAARLVPPGDGSALAAALHELLTDQAARARMATAARAAADGPYSWDEAARHTLSLYRSLLA
jgi:glycosyltransferase involved in cell wall biosynthesis